MWPNSKSHIDLTSVVAAVTVFVVFLAFALVIRLPMGLVVVSLPVILFVVAISLVLRLVDRRHHPVPPIPPFPVASGALIAVGIWTMGIVPLVGWLPGGFGPIQYAAGSPMAMFVFDQQLGTVLAMMTTPVIGALIGSVRLATYRQFRAGWFVFGIASYFIAWVVLFKNTWFLPNE